MSTIKSSDEHLTLNADGTSKDIKLQSNASEKVIVKSDGKVGIGETSPQGTLHVKTSDSGATAVAGADDLIVEVADYGGISILSENEGHIYFGDNEDADVGRIEYQHSENNMVFRTNASDALTINSSGYMGIGTTSPSNYLHVKANPGNTWIARFHNESGTNSPGIIVQAQDSASPNYSLLRTYTSVTGDIEHNLRGDGNAYCDGSWSGGGADYAEYFEWSDGNASNEDRRGFSVVLDGDKIRPAVDGESPIGVISGRPVVIGDNDIDRWKQKYLRDDFGAYIWESKTHTVWQEQVIDDEGVESEIKKEFQSDRIPANETVPDNAVVKTEDEEGRPLTRKKLNPEWNEDEEYISREDRPEWDTVGLMGKLRIRKGQPTGSTWIKMRDVSDTVEEWLIR